MFAFPSCYSCHFAWFVGAGPMHVHRGQCLHMWSVGAIKPTTGSHESCADQGRRPLPGPARRWPLNWVPVRPGTQGRRCPDPAWQGGGATQGRVHQADVPRAAVVVMWQQEWLGLSAHLEVPAAAAAPLLGSLLGCAAGRAAGKALLGASRALLGAAGALLGGVLVAGAVRVGARAVAPAGLSAVKARALGAVWPRAAVAPLPQALQAQTGWEMRQQGPRVPMRCVAWAHEGSW